MRTNLWVLAVAALLAGTAAGQPPDAGKTDKGPKGPPDEEKAILGEIREAYKAPYEVPEDIRKELNLRSAEGVAVFEVIGDSLAELAGIKVGAVIAEINKKPVRDLEDFGRLMAEALPQGNFTIGTWEPTNPENQGQGGQMNFHFVPKRTD